jgi:uncharacterized membrane protein YkvA (DUF1232 family)
MSQSLVFWILIDCAVALIVASLVVIAVAFRARSRDQSLGSMVRVLPDSIRLAAALHGDRNLPRSVRWRLRIALVYNLQPINLIPDFVPVIGFADNLFVIAWALREAVSTAGTDVVESHWQGSPEGLRALYRALRLGAGPPGERSRSRAASPR